jgi:GntR family carbon starvation induced transcriptional regulator
MANNVLRMTEPPDTESGSVLSQTAYQLIRREILSGRIPPGSKLKIDALQKQFGISSSPLREALTRLSAEDCVIADRRRGFRAARVSLGDLNDITDFRLLLEVHGLVESIERGTKAWEADIVAAFDRLTRAEEQLPRPTRSLSDLWIDLHKGFHMALVSASASARLREQCSSLFDQSQRYRNLYTLHRTGAGMRNGSAEHRAILDAALNRDRTLAAALLREHISKTARYVANFLE